jgi:hypothetical protein
MNWIEIVGLVFGSVLGGQWLINMITLKSQKKKAAAEAKKVDSEAKKVDVEAEGERIDNAQKLVSMWEDLSKKRAEEDAKVIAKLESMIKTLTAKMDKVIKAIDKANDCPGVENCIVLKELDKKELDKN